MKVVLFTWILVSNLYWYNKHRIREKDVIQVIHDWNCTINNQNASFIDILWSIHLTCNIFCWDKTKDPAKNQHRQNTLVSHSGVPCVKKKIIWAKKKRWPDQVLIRWTRVDSFWFERTLGVWFVLLMKQRFLSLS